ncbi:hypothetical protein DMR_36540 [Solidesulfovibrio magneticus RS-1]|uniref:Uncharacterized protein n=1 Tax=Solidesulfovibrio magneticus (strain ATCC 700980 / DSM 13731 / RS-1) TaxID=573370 RepID=C4XM17_SOLM1|nr:hypothetical protein DMR_36540 [Solidesulfovibrio magneticus RS-1]
MTAPIHSLFETAKANGLEQCRYLLHFSEQWLTTTADAQRKPIPPSHIYTQGMTIPA